MDTFFYGFIKIILIVKTKYIELVKNQLRQILIKVAIEIFNTNNL